MRLLSATRGSSSRGASSSRKSDKHKPELIFHLPGFGIQYLAVPPPRDDLEAQRQATREMKGELEVRMPVDMGIKRAKRLRIGLKTLVRLAMGDGRGWEEDVVYETEYDLGTMLYLHPGSNRYVSLRSMYRYEVLELMTGTLSPSCSSRTCRRTTGIPRQTCGTSYGPNSKVHPPPLPSSLKLFASPHGPLPRVEHLLANTLL